MVQQLKILIVILAMAMLTFLIVKPVVVRFASEQDFIRRRNIWILLCSVAILSPSFWVFALAATIAYLWARGRDSTPVALYVFLLHVIPPPGQEIPGIGGIRIFELTNFRLLALSMLLPLAWRAFSTRGEDSFRRFTITDFFVLAYCLLQLLLPIANESATNTLRRGLLLILDVGLPYYVFSRTLKDRRQVIDFLAMLFVACAVMATIGLFESLRKWPLYGELSDIWNLPQDATTVYRGDALRALATSGHPLLMGYLCAIGFGFWLYLARGASSKLIIFGFGAWMWIGLVTAYSRGPWLVAAAIFFVYMALQPRGFVRLMQASVVVGVLSGAALLSPIGDKIIDNLPFVGSVGDVNVVYRQRLADISWYLIMQNPLFGDLFVLERMGEMRQGEGIIDLVNTYAAVALFYGLVGLSFFCGVMLTSALKLFGSLRRAARYDQELSTLGACLLACSFGTAFMLVTCSFIFGLAQMFWILAGLGVTYERLERKAANGEPV
jgi:hypothetical protein